VRMMPVRIPDLRNIEVIDDATAAMYRAMTPAQTVAIACDAHDTARAMTAARVREQHPDWPADRVRLEVGRRLTRESA
jgi:hypothetical protein